MIIYLPCELLTFSLCLGSVNLVMSFYSVLYHLTTNIYLITVFILILVIGANVIYQVYRYNYQLITRFCKM